MWWGSTEKAEEERRESGSEERVKEGQVGKFVKPEAEVREVKGSSRGRRPAVFEAAEGQRRDSCGDMKSAGRQPSRPQIGRAHV